MGPSESFISFIDICVSHVSTEQSKESCSDGGFLSFVRGKVFMIQWLLHLEGLVPLSLDYRILSDFLEVTGSPVSTGYVSLLGHVCPNKTCSFEAGQGHGTSTMIHLSSYDEKC